MADTGSKEGQPLFSITADDCDWSYTRGSGNGGQKKAKTSSAVHCMHRPSGAHGYAQDTRSQRSNRELAFSRMFRTDKFQKWLRIEAMRRSGRLEEIERNVCREMDRVKIEMRENGVWVQIKKDTPLE